jgi:hypothetical protein
MIVDGSVSRSSGEILVLSVCDVRETPGVTILLGQTKVDNVDLVCTVGDPHKEIVGLDVTMDEMARVNVLDSIELFHHINTQSTIRLHQNCEIRCN